MRKDFEAAASALIEVDPYRRQIKLVVIQGQQMFQQLTSVQAVVKQGLIFAGIL